MIRRHGLLFESPMAWRLSSSATPAKRNARTSGGAASVKRPTAAADPAAAGAHGDLRHLLRQVYIACFSATHEETTGIALFAEEGVGRLPC